ncbi:hypothetical protein BDP27DRAFT_1385337 [Rhodocollybia butyracea]|uniref:CxC2-like cysteine cluster KDZ transposase-associated domain-containing protein n=1 Tax=Rhodocollybia butyracea TaxID=206335 RepID=A0A9P5TZG4_9AGAR|nr:hypothetical protein BDP27DRAFT_1385337 [Rhodocollybia butyracea]
MSKIIPLIIPTYIELQRQTRSLRDKGVTNVEAQKCDCCQTAHKLSIWVYHFSKFEQIELWASECSKASVQLVRSGLFPCSPIFPMLAVDIHVLDFVCRLFLHIAPNYTAWCSTATNFLAAQGYHLPGDDPLRRRFATALQWFMFLNEMTSARINNILHGVHADLVPNLSVTGTYWSPAAHCNQETPTMPEEPANIVVNVDACFTQKYSAKGGRDPPCAHPNTFFIPEEEVNAWKQHTTEDSEDQDNHLKGALRVPKSVLDGCLVSFTAADEARIKGSTQFFDIAANMTLLCRHDCSLFSVNMTTAGEGQHYVLALLGKLFEHLPSDFFVRLLYNIGCQLHQSCDKWGFLKSYMNQMTFAVHQWPCQIVYHPRKCLGYGLCYGEGAEHLWHTLSHLIAYGRVTGLGTWLHWKSYACEVKLREAEEVLHESGFPEDVLRHEWKAQSAVKEAIRLHKSRDTAQAHVDELRRRIIDVLSEHWEVATAELELEAALNVLTKARAKSPFLVKKMNARALKTHIREHLRAQQRINEHTQDLIKQRDPSIADLARWLIQQKKAPRNSVAPVKIEMEGLFNLHVDDDIWLDIGLGYEEEDETIPPLWLSNDKVHMGIHALLD